MKSNPASVYWRLFFPFVSAFLMTALTFLLFTFNLPVSAAPVISVSTPAELITALENANANGAGLDVIVLAPGVYTFTGVYSAKNALPGIATKIEIQGQNAVFARAGGAPAFRFIEVLPSGSLRLSNLTLRGGQVQGDGGALLVQGQVELDNCAFQNNISQQGNGGAVAILPGAIFKMNGGMVQNNQATGGYAGGGVYNYSGTASITGTLIQGNSASGGGGIMNASGTFTITGASILRNSVDFAGGGVYNQRIQFNVSYPPATLLISDTTLAYNQSRQNTSQSGAAVYTLNDTSIVNSRLYGNSYGAIFHSKGPYTSRPMLVRNSCFFNNPAGGTLQIASITNYLGSTTDAAANYWGAADGPSGIGPGSGDSVDAATTYQPFLTALPAHCTAIQGVFSVAIQHRLPLYRYTSLYGTGEFYWLPHDTAVPLTATVSGLNIANPAVHWDIRSGSGALAITTGVTTTFLAGPDKADTVVRATSLEDPAFYAEFSIHTARERQLKIAIDPVLVYNRDYPLGFFYAIDGLQFTGSDHQVVAARLSGTGVLTQTGWNYSYHTPAVEGGAVLQAYSTDYPNFMTATQALSTVYGGPFDCDFQNWTYQTWGIMGGTIDPNYPRLTRLQYQVGNIGRQSTIGTTYNLNQPADDPLQRVAYMIKFHNGLYGPFPMQQTGVSGGVSTWSGDNRNPTGCGWGGYVLIAANAQYTDTLNFLVTKETPATPSPKPVVDPTFQPGGANSHVWAGVLLEGGKILIGGDFTQYGGAPAGRIARLNPDGSLDPTFNTGTGANWTVTSLGVQPDGKILAGGWFTSFNGVPAQGIVRLEADGALDPSFNSGAGFNYGVYALRLQQDGRILAGGHFSRYDNTPAYGVIRLQANGAVDPTFQPGIGADGAVYDILLLDDGSLILGGSFTRFNRLPALRVVKLTASGAVDPGFAPPGLSDNVLRLAAGAGGKIYLAGLFERSILRLLPNGAPDYGFEVVDRNNLINGAVHDILELPDGRVMVAGDFTAIGWADQARHSPHIAVLNPNSSLDKTFDFGTNPYGTVERLLPISAARVLALGRFTTMDTALTPGAARLMLDSPAAIFTGKLPDAAYGTPYTATVLMTGLPAPTYTLASGALPAGLSLASVFGGVRIAGTPTETGVFPFVLEARNGSGPAAQRMYTLTVSTAAVGLAITSISPSPSYYGQPVTITLAISSSAGLPAGDVLVQAGSQSCTITLPDLQCSLAFNQSGVWPVQASFAGSQHYSPSLSAIVQHTVNVITGKVLITSILPAVIYPDQSIQVGMSISAPYQASLSGAFIVQGPLPEITCTAIWPQHACQIGPLPIGTHNLSASFPGNPEYILANSDPVSVTVVGYPVQVSITGHTPSPSRVGDGVTVTVALNTLAQGKTPAGLVTIRSSGGGMCMINLSLDNSCVLFLYSPGIQDLTASYAGDAYFASAVSAPHKHEVKTGWTVFVPILRR